MEHDAGCVQERAMSDDINTDAIAVVARLKAAGLLVIAERAAARIELRLRDCISLGEVTGGHVALWRALLASGKNTRDVAILTGWRQDVIARETATPLAAVVVPEPRPTPSPASGVRKTAPKPTEPGPKPVAPAPKGLTSADVKAMIEVACAPLRARIAELERRASLFEVEPRGGEDLAIAHLARQGAAGDVVRKVATESNVPLYELLYGARSPMMTAARRECVRILTRNPFAMSQTEIGRVLRLDRSSVHGAQQATGAVPRRARIRRAA